MRRGEQLSTYLSFSVCSRLLHIHQSGLRSALCCVLKRQQMQGQTGRSWSDGREDALNPTACPLHGSAAMKPSSSLKGAPWRISSAPLWLSKAFRHGGLSQPGACSVSHCSPPLAQLSMHVGLKEHFDNCKICFDITLTENPWSHYIWMRTQPLSNSALLHLVG